MGSIVSSETTAAAAGAMGQLRRDPFAMLPFCGYHMGDYFAHWLKIGKRAGAKLPAIFYVNWFRKSPEGKFLWPGYGENSRVLKWVFERCEGAAGADQTPIGAVPRAADLDLEGLKLAPEALGELLKVNRAEWLAETDSIAQHFARFGDRLPSELAEALAALKAKLS